MAPDQKLISIKNLDGNSDIFRLAQKNYGSLVNFKTGIKDFVFANFQEGHDFFCGNNDCLKLLMQNYKFANANFERSLDRVMANSKGSYNGNTKNPNFDGFQEKGVNE